MLNSFRMCSSARLGWLLVLLALSVVPSVQGAPSFSENVRLLKGADDFRVRTQAALALGASATTKAVPPLCHALADDNRTVRIAAVSALAKLNKGGIACLKRRAEVERNASVLTVIKKAVLSLSGGGGAERAISSSTRYLVALEKLSGPKRLNGPVRNAFVRMASRDPKFAFAPAGQRPAASRKALSKYPGNTGFLLAPRLSRPKYQGGVLSIKISVAIMSYPGGSLIGSFSKTVGMSGVTQADPEAENELVVTAAEEAMKEFLRLASTLVR